MTAYTFDISKPSDLLYKPVRSGTNGNLLSLLTNYLTNWRQRDTLPAVMSDIVDIGTGVPQGSALCPFDVFGLH